MIFIRKINRLLFLINISRVNFWVLFLFIACFVGIIDLFGVFFAIDFVRYITSKDSLLRNIFDLTTSNYFFFLITWYISSLSTSLFAHRKLFKSTARIQCHVANKICQNFIGTTFPQEKLINISVIQAQRVAFSIFQPFMLAGVKIVGALSLCSYLFYQYPEMGGIFIGILVLVVLPVATIIRKKSIKLGTFITTINDDRLKHLNQVSEGFVEIFVFSLQKKYLELIQKLNERFSSNQVQIQFLNYSPRVCFEALVLLSFISILYWMSSFQNNTEEQILVIATFGLIGFRASTALMQVFTVSVQIFSNSHALDEVLKFAECDLAAVNEEDASTIAETQYTGKAVDRFVMPPTTLDLGSRKLKIKQTVFLRGITLIYGASGVGKTTYGSVIGGIPCHNTAKISHAEFAEVFSLSSSVLVRMTDLSRYVCYIQQFPKFFSGSVRENIFKDISAGNLKKLDFFEFDVDETRDQLSGGELSRLAFLRGIYDQREILLLDEPTASLDNVSCSKLIEILESCNDKIIIIITHDKRLLERKYHKIDFHSIIQNEK